MQEILEIIKPNETYILMGLSFLSLALLIFAIVLSVKIGRINRRRSVKLSEGNVADIVDHLTKQSEDISTLKTSVVDLLQAQASMRSELEKCLKNVNIVRFNAFDDVGGEQSFALALCDENKNGVIISNLYGRQESRMYAKIVSQGQSERPLLDEEQRAVNPK